MPHNVFSIDAVLDWPMSGRTGGTPFQREALPMKSLVFRFSLHAVYVGVDLACIWASILLGYATYRLLSLGHETTYTLENLLVSGLGLSVLVFTFLHMLGAYRRDSGMLNVLEIRGVILGVLCSFAVVSALFYALRLHPSRYTVFLTFAFLLLLLLLCRSALYNLLSARMPESLQRRVLVYGAGELGQRLFRELHASPRLGVRVMGFIDDDPFKMGRRLTEYGYGGAGSCKVLGGGETLAHHVPRLRIHEVIIAISNISSARLKELMDFCRRFNVRVAVVPNLYDITAHKIVLDQVGNLPMVRELDSRGDLAGRLGKRCLDLSLAVVLGLLLLPLLLVIAWLIRRDSPGPVLFAQERVGRDGKPFTIYKFRTMYQDAPRYAVNPLDAADPRITRVGRFLRRTSLDELPQILNVLKGEMSFVGPRPEMPFIVARYGPRERERLTALPGITGLWQLSGDRSAAIHENLGYDLYYIYNQSFFLDVTILFQTLIFAFRGV